MSQDLKQLSDGYHTFAELYNHRYHLFLALCAALIKIPVPCEMWRSQQHDDGTMFDDSFIVGATLPTGQLISYHLPMRLWEQTAFIDTRPTAPPWDGHTSDDVIQRLAAFIQEQL